MLRKGLSKLRDFAEYPFIKHSRAARTFEVGGEQHHYLTHHYNSTWRNERAVEIPLAAKFLARQRPGARLLEVGNVLSYYLDASHTVVDKFEPTPGVINKDILDFDQPKAFDCIVSISTLEHVGWDEQPREPERAELALRHMRSLLTEGGAFFLSFPIGYNPTLDGLVFDDRMGFRATHYLKRVSADNAWEEVSLDAIRRAKYGAPYPCANALFVGVD